MKNLMLFHIKMQKEYNFELKIYFCEFLQVKKYFYN